MLLTDASVNNILETDKRRWLSNDQIREKKLLIARFNEKCLTPVGYDVRVGERYLKMHGKVRDFDRLPENGELILLPKEIVAIETEEFIGMPQSKEYSGIVVSKVSVVEKGLSHISTSVDPDWKGNLIITITNHADRKITFRRGQALCTVIFFKNETPAQGSCEKNPDKHISSLLEDWKIIGKRTRRTLFFLGMRTLLVAAPLLWLLYKYIYTTISEAEAALFIAIFSFLSFLLFIVPEKI